MKKRQCCRLLLGAVLSLGLCFGMNAQAQTDSVKIEASVFPDAKFRETLLAMEIGQDGVLTAKELENQKVLSVSNKGIKDLTGVKVFTSLEKLYCERNELTELPELPTGLEELWCHYNQLTGLSKLPDTLEMLYCIHNELTELPELPKSLNSLYCDDNQLKELPNMPSGMRWLYCNRNQLSKLPELPSGIISIRCYSNELTELPALPRNMKSLYCYDNQLTELPELPTSLNWLYCSGNELQSLPELPETLMELHCGGNQLTKLPDLPSNLVSLSCTNNLLEEMPELSKMTVNLWCANNRLTSLRLNEEASYECVDVSGNLIAYTAAVSGNSGVVWGAKDSYGAVKYKYFPQNGSVPENEVASIRIKQMPNTTEFRAGDVLDLSGLIVEGTLNDGSKVDLIGYTITGYNMETEGKQTLRISYGLRSATLDITILEGKNMISAKHMTVTAGMYEEAYPAENVLDGEPSTIWLTSEKGTKNYNNHWIQFEFDQNYFVHGLRYQPRQDYSQDGVITQYEILTSKDGINWSRVIGGSWSANREWKKVVFPGQEVKYIRLVSENSVNSMGDVVYSSAAEIRILGSTEPCAHENKILVGYKEATYERNGYTGDLVCEYCENILEKGRVIKKAKSNFTDVQKTDFFYEPVIWAIQEKVTTGCTETEFAPYDICTRSQVVTFLWRIAGEPEAANKDLAFLDVPQDSFYYDAVCWAVEENVTTGVSETQFAPNEPCTRGQLVTLIWNIMGRPEINTENPFNDVPETEFFHDAVLWAHENEITRISSTGSFGSYKACTRGEAVTFLFRAFEEMK